MNIINTTNMPADLSVSVDKDGAEHYLLVVKGTFDMPADGGVATLSRVQRKLTVADEYIAEPGNSSIRDAYDYCLRKPKTDIVLVGSAHAPRGMQATRLDVSIAIGKLVNKTIRVIGDRVWEKNLFGELRPSEPEFFRQIPLIYERAYGGSDTSHPEEKYHRFHRANLVGRGVYGKRDKKSIVGLPLPNLANPGRHINKWGEATDTLGFSFVSPAWTPRITYSGSYDQIWLDNRYPLLPDDFNEFFFQTAPPDQIVDRIDGGEEVCLVNMNTDGPIKFRLPHIDLPAVFMFKEHGDKYVKPVLDTVVIRPDEKILTMVWRVAQRRIGKLYSLRKVVVGEKAPRWFALQRSTKPYYKNLDEYIREKNK